MHTFLTISTDFDEIHYTLPILPLQNLQFCVIFWSDPFWISDPKFWSDSKWNKIHVQYFSRNYVIDYIVVFRSMSVFPKIIFNFIELMCMSTLHNHLSFILCMNSNNLQSATHHTSIKFISFHSDSINIRCGTPLRISASLTRLYDRYMMLRWCQWHKIGHF